MKTLTKEEVARDIEENRNYSWIMEVLNRHKNEMDREIMEYFSRNITYRELFDEGKKLADALRNDGIGKGTEFVVCIDRIPEYAYLICAASMIGAKINIVSEKFDKDYLQKKNKKSTGSKIFVQDRKLDYFEELIEEFPDREFITVSHKRSIRETEDFQKFVPFIERFYKDEHTKVDRSKFRTYDEFLEDGLDYDGPIFEKVTLDDPLTVTYSSGTTRKGFPKGIVHCNRHYITMGRYHDPEVSGVPSLKKLKTYSNIPGYSNTFLLSSLSDNLIMGGRVVLDPIDDLHYFIPGIKLHESHMNVATTTTWQIGALDYYFGNEYGVDQLPSAMFNFSGGEQLSAGEEKFLNRFLGDVKAGTGLTHTPVSLAKMCTAGADCEHGSVMYRLLRAYYNNQPYRIGRAEPVGMKVYDFVDFKVLRRDGTYCLPLEHGRLVANSACNMVGYNHDDEEMKGFFIYDAYGKKWADMKVFAFYDEKNAVSIKGRYTDEKVIPCYLIADEIQKDTKKIMSCEVVMVNDNGRIYYVAHILPQYGTSFNVKKVLDGATKRCINKFGEGITELLFYRIHDLREMFPVADSSKRNVPALAQEGLSKVEDYKYEVPEKKSSKGKVLIK